MYCPLPLAVREGSRRAGVLVKRTQPTQGPTSGPGEGKALQATTYPSRGPHRHRIAAWVWRFDQTQPAGILSEETVDDVTHGWVCCCGGGDGQDLGGSRRLHALWRVCILLTPTIADLLELNSSLRTRFRSASSAAACSQLGSSKGKMSRLVSFQTHRFLDPTNSAAKDALSQSQDFV